MICGILLAALAHTIQPPPSRPPTGQQGGRDTIQDTWTLHAERVYTSTGEVLKNAIVQVEDGKITAIRAGRSRPRGALGIHAISAGMLDLSARVNTGITSVEQTSEVQPHLAVSQSVDLYDDAWERLARSGLTTVLISPFDRNVIGGRAVALKTAGPRELEARRVETRPVIRGAIGSEPSSGNHAAFGRPTDFYSRRPTTRMGVEWEWRKAFFDAVSAERLPEREFPGAAELRAALKGERLLMIQAWATQDIRTAVYLKEEMMREGFGELDLIIDAAAEAWKEPQLLVRTGTAVVLPPFSGSGRTGPERAFMAWNTAKLLVDDGVTVCLSSHGARSPAAHLDKQAGFAMRGGLTFEEALAAVTINPARVLGVEKRLGSVEIGKDADLVLWNGQPFEPTTRIVGVLVDGELVVDPRPANER